MITLFAYDNDGKLLTSLAQWDSNVYVYFKHPKITSNYPVHFCNIKSEYAYVVNPTYQGGYLKAKVPNALLTQPYAIYAYVYVPVDGGERTIYRSVINVIARKKPDGYVYVGTEDYITISQVRAELLEEIRKIEVGETAIDATLTEQGKAADAQATGIAISTKYTKPAGGIPESDLSQSVISKLNNVGGGSSVEIDSTLTVSGKAADAKATGEKIADVDTKVGLKYAKPSSGIPETDLSADVQRKLNSTGSGGSENYDDTELRNMIGAKYTKPIGGIPESDLSEEVQWGLVEVDPEPVQVPDTPTPDQETDTTLTKAGHAADAKTVGDKFAEVNTSLDKKYERPDGGITEDDLSVDIINKLNSSGGGSSGGTVELDSTLSSASKAAQAKAVGDRFAQQQTDIDSKMNKLLLTYNGAAITKYDGSAITYQQIYDHLMGGTGFSVLVYQNMAYHPNQVTPEQIVFVCSYPTNGYITSKRITLSDSGTVTVTSGEAEKTSSRVSVIADEDKASTTKYPSVKAVVDYVTANSGNGSKESGVITYDVFPSASALAQMPDETVFRTKGFYEIGDGGDGEYIATKKYLENCFKVVSGAVTVNVKPLGDSKMLELSKCGLREGAGYGAANDAVIASLNLNFGMAIKFPQGHYYFGTGIDCTAKHLSIFGSGCTYTSDINTKGCTWLHFPDSDFGIKVNHCTLSDFNIVGNSTKNTVKVDRDQTYVNPAGIVTLTDTADTKGIYSVGNAKITNVAFRNWRYGLYCDTGNVYIDNVLARNCIVGVSTGNDAQLRGIYGWQIGTLWEARGGAVQASQLRADSVAQNLVRIVKGSGFYISGMNADYCYGSIVRIGSGNWQTIKNLTINGITGRWGCGACYDKTKDTAPTAQGLTADNLHLLPFISVDNNTSLVGADITLGGGGSNPLDTASNYLTPDAILCGGANSQVYGVSVRLSTSLEYAQNLDLDYLKNHFRSLSGYAQALKISVDSANSKVIFQQTGGAANPTFTVNAYGFDGTTGAGSSGSAAAALYKTPYDYGAKGDGMADDTAAFEALLANNDFCYIPVGCFRITRPLTITRTSCTIKGASSLHGHIVGIQNANLAQYKAAGTCNSVIYADFASDGTLFTQSTIASDSKAATYRFSISDVNIVADKYKATMTKAGVWTEDRNSVIVNGIETDQLEIERVGFSGFSGVALKTTQGHPKVDTVSFENCWRCVEATKWDAIFVNIWACKCGDVFWLTENSGQTFQWNGVWADQILRNVITFTADPYPRVIIDGLWVSLIGHYCIECAEGLDASGNAKGWLSGSIINSAINRCNIASDGGTAAIYAPVIRRLLYVGQSTASTSSDAYKPLIDWGTDCLASVIICPMRPLSELSVKAFPSGNMVLASDSSNSELVSRVTAIEQELSGVSALIGDGVI